VSNGNEPVSAIFDDSKVGDQTPYTLTIFNVQQTDLIDSVKAVTDFFLERYEKKHEIISEENSDDLEVSVFDRTIALLVNEKGAADGSSEIGRIINVLKHDKAFKMYSDFLDVFRAKISTYDE
jgi:hypothetical protein